VEKATISELKNRLSAYLKKVRAGHSVLILDRDQPVAKLEAVVGGTAHDDKLARLERAGLIRRGTSRPALEALRAAAPAAARSVTDALVAERRDSR
jgi:antitoxin (DNA-binding transcriptional repressor) of toxin-antitoxin stability system